MSLIEVRRRKASAVRLRFSQSLASRRQRLSQAMVRSHDPSLGQHLEAAGGIRSLDDLQLDLTQHALQCGLERRSLVAAVSVELAQEREHTEQGRQQQHAALAVLEVGGVDDGVQHQAERVDQDVPLLALDLLAPVVAVRVDRGPPFSALLTLWLSMIAAVGLASRPACSRHCT